MSELTVLQSKFINQYLMHGIGSKAVIEAGGSPNGASVTANRFLKNPKIAAEIARRRAKIQEKSELSEKKLKDALNELVDFDPADMYDEKGDLLPIAKMPAHTRKAIAGFEESVGKMGGKDRKFKLSSRLQAIEMGLKLLGLLKNEPQQQQAVQIVISAPPNYQPAPPTPIFPDWGPEGEPR
jgi:phage terminase small subunit